VYSQMRMIGSNTPLSVVGKVPLQETGILSKGATPRLVLGVSCAWPRPFDDHAQASLGVAPDVLQNVEWCSQREHHR
jgi:hypothetical protein